jgi:predicted metal-dependent peptidase
MDKAREAKLRTKVAKARTALVLEHPFVGTIALNMPYHFDTSIPTAATNGKYIVYNPDFLEGLTDDETKFLVAHECFHPMLEHNFRRMGRNPKKWNRAGDYVINYHLAQENIGKLISGVLHSPDIYNAGGGSTDGIYKILEDNEGDNDGDGGSMGDDLQDSPGSPADQAQQQAEWKVTVAQAAQAAKMMGKMSANLERLVGQILQPKVAWQDVLHRFLVKCKNDSRTYARPNRRFIQQGLYLPTISGEAMGEIVFCVDMSGSISDEVASQFAAEVRKVWEDLHPAKLHIVFFSHEVCAYDVFSPGDEFAFKPRGGGGTAFSPCFEFIKEKDIDAACVVFLTDLCCDDFGTAPEAPVLWVSTDEGTAPFGEVVLM